ncbi:hypothetical protein Pcinc_039806 [Petrolisthes cinctipes]|uniref:Uncharacterized protein n=1 Tax=Petrolisthes cinctipes TaxID=88211 RepID=A0AAE1BP18_PETCI|nr:hypothetical protein Pcinc_039806 [Petrolisthes cinctipes]
MRSEGKEKESRRNIITLHLRSHHHHHYHHQHHTSSSSSGNVNDLCGPVHPWLCVYRESQWPPDVTCDALLTTAYHIDGERNCGAQSLDTPPLPIDWSPGDTPFLSHCRSHTDS